MIEPNLKEGLIGDFVLWETVLRQSSAEVPAIGDGKQRQIGPDRICHRNDPSFPGRNARNPCHPREAFRLAEPLGRSEEKSLIGLYRPPRGKPELVATEFGLSKVEEVTSIEIVVSVEPERRTMDLVRS